MTNTTYWVISLILGAVVLVAVTVLLHMLLSQLRIFEKRTEALWNMGKRVASNTATTWMLGETSHALSLLLDETNKHELLLNEVLAAKGGRLSGDTSSHPDNH